MIAKKVPNPKKSASKTARAAGLADYIREPERENGLEKCIHSEAENFLTLDPQAQIAEMVALSQESLRSKDPIDHWVLSWRSDEHPTLQQAKKAVEIFIEHCGLHGHQYIWGLHDDTQNKHVHIAVNRVNPETLKVTEINKGFDREAAQQAIALIEHEQNWLPEKGSRYVIENGKPTKRDQDPDKPRKPSSHAVDMELQTGEKSAQRIGIEAAAPIIKKASSWAEVHAKLAEQGIRYERKGSGALVYIGDVPIKASDVDRAASLTALQKRLGEYEPAGQDIAIVKRIEPQPMQANQPGWKEYIAIRDEQKANKPKALLAMQKRQTAERNQLYAKLKAERTAALQGDWKGKGAQRNTIVSILATTQALEKLALQQQHKAERKQYQEQYQAIPQYKEWRELPAIIGASAQVPRSALESLTLSYTTNTKGHVTYRSNGAEFFRDEGRRIAILNTKSDQAMSTALAVAQQKFGKTLTLTGSSAFLKRAVAVAVQNNMQINFSDPRLEELRKQLELEKMRPGQNTTIGSKMSAADWKEAVALVGSEQIALPKQNDEYAGKVILVTDTHLVQLTGKNTAIAHDISKLANAKDIEQLADTGQLQGKHFMLKYDQVKGTAAALRITTPEPPQVKEDVKSPPKQKGFGR